MKTGGGHCDCLLFFLYTDFTDYADEHVFFIFCSLPCIRHTCTAPNAVRCKCCEEGALTDEAIPLDKRRLLREDHPRNDEVLLYLYGREIFRVIRVQVFSPVPKHLPLDISDHQPAVANGGARARGGNFGRGLPEQIAAHSVQRKEVALLGQEK